MSSSTTYFPPGVECFRADGGGGWNKNGYRVEGCNVTNDMLAFLNLTSSVSSYVAAYCLSPPSDDGCPFGFCPRPNIAGM